MKNNNRSEKSELSSVAEASGDVVMSSSPSPEMFQTEKLYTGMYISPITLNPMLSLANPVYSRANYFTNLLITSRKKTGNGMIE